MNTWKVTQKILIIRADIIVIFIGRFKISHILGEGGGGVIANPWLWVENLSFGKKMKNIGLEGERRP